MRRQVLKAERRHKTAPVPFTHSDFVLPRQVGPFTQQLGLRQRQHTGRFPDQHRVVQLGVSWG